MSQLTWTEYDSQGKLHPLFHAGDYILVAMRTHEVTACYWPTRVPSTPRDPLFIDHYLGAYHVGD